LSVIQFDRRILSGMRPTGKLHLGHYHGVLKNWIKLQHECECFFAIVDWHALTTHYEDPYDIEHHVWDMAIDWLAAGINPGSATVFIQSRVPEHAELHLLLSMITPLSWLERVPTYKEQQEKIKDKDLATYGFLGYPLLQAADILVYRSGSVPVGADQIPHVEMCREIARRFNHLYGRDAGFVEQAEAAIKKMGKKASKAYRQLKNQYQERGDQEALERAVALVNEQQNISLSDRERLVGFIEGGGKVILPEPKALLTEDSKMPGLDGQKMSKSYGNTIALREAPEVVEQKIRTMQTDPARVRRTDPGDPDKCPVWQLHEVYTDRQTQDWVQEGCRNATIGCLDCKQPVIDAVNAELEPIRARAREYENDHDVVRGILAEGCEAARDEARQTLELVREAIGLRYR